jgi:CrcB protein
MARAIAVFLAGGIGSLTRYWMGGAVHALFGTSLPVGTFAVNVLGCLGLGIIVAVAIERDFMDTTARVMLTAGFCGGFTTMSAFSYETVALLQAGRPGWAITNVLATIIACLASTGAGLMVGRAL